MGNSQFSCQSCELNEAIFSKYLEKVVYLCHQNNNFFIYSPDRIRCVYWRSRKEKDSKPQTQISKENVGLVEAC